MEEMVEPDRTIMIVSIVGLVIIWGSVAYHKFVQGGGAGQVSSGDEVPISAATEDEASASADQAVASEGSSAQPGRTQRKEGKKRKRKG